MEQAVNDAWTGQPRGGTMVETPRLDIGSLRAATPGCDPALGIHLHHGGASLPSSETLRTVQQHLELEARDGLIEAGTACSPRLEEVRAAAATLLGATPNEVAFASSGSAAFGLAFAGLPPLRPGDRILVGRHEWGGNLATMRAAADRVGASIETIPCQNDGSVDADALGGLIDDRVRLVSLTWLPANGGLINDAAAIGRVTDAAGVPCFIDAGQALGQLPVDVRALGCDVLVGAGRKHLRGPRGTGLLYVRQTFQEKLSPVFLDPLSGPWMGDAPRLRRDARRYETQELPLALVLGLGSAIRQALSLGVPAIRSRVSALAETLRSELVRLEGVEVVDLGRERSGLVAFTVAGVSPATLRASLAERRIRIGANGPVYTPLDMQARGLEAVARASLSYLNTEAELATFVAAVASAAGEARA